MLDEKKCDDKMPDDETIAMPGRMAMLSWLSCCHAVRHRTRAASAPTMPLIITRSKHTHTPKNKKYAVRSLFYPPRSRSPSTLSRFPLHFPSSSPSSFSSSPTPPFLLGSRESRSGTLVCLWLLTFMRVRVVYRG